MKTIIKNFLIIMIITLVLSSCKKEDNTPSSTNKFSIENTEYITPNAYLLLDDGPLYTNGFGIVLLEGTMREDNINGSSISTDTDYGLVLWVTLGFTQVSSESAITNQITNNSTFTLNDETRAITNITLYTNTYMSGGVQYGDPDDDSAMLYDINTGGSYSLMVNTFSVNLTDRNGTIDCTFSFRDDNNNLVSGSYNGSFEIINEF